MMETAPLPNSQGHTWRESAAPLPPISDQDLSLAELWFMDKIDPKLSNGDVIGLFWSTAIGAIVPRAECFSKRSKSPMKFEIHFYDFNEGESGE
jgi:hypothetical protein